MEKTNRVFAAENAGFKEACTVALVAPTARQASKYRRGLGAAYKRTPPPTKKNKH